MNISILILHHASILSEIDDSRITDLLKQCIAKLEVENDKIKAENDKTRTENVELKASIIRSILKKAQGERIVPNVFEINDTQTLQEYLAR